VPKPETAAQLARHERSQKQLGQKHLPRPKMWACVRIASRLLAWRGRARALRQHKSYGYRAIMLDQCVERCALYTANRISIRAAARGVPIDGDRKLPILVGTLLLQQWPSARARRPRPAALPAPPTSSAAAAQLLPALALAAPPPPSQPPGRPSSSLNLRRHPNLVRHPRLLSLNPAACRGHDSVRYRGVLTREY
jgi:hypothetical protein